MKKIIVLFSTAFFLLVSCEDRFLDLEDQDSITENLFFDQAQDFEQGANRFYRGLHSPQRTNTGSGSDGFDMISDYGTELSGYIQDYGQGTNNATATDVYWANGYSFIREINLLMEKADEFIANGGSQAEISESIATAYFFRAYQHFRLLKRFGGVPIVTQVTNPITNLDFLFEPRNSRYEVVAQILADLDLAIADLPETAIGANLGKISSVAAIAFKARVLLFEGTWEKYVGTATDFEGSGTDNNSEAYIAQAVTACQTVMNSGQYAIWNKNDDPNMNNDSYRWLFSLEGVESNPGGYTKASNNEFIIQTVFDFDSNNRIGAGIFTQINQGRNAPTQIALDMYSSIDGLPIDKSPLFQGYAVQSDQFINRDRRMHANFIDNVIDGGSNKILPISNVNNSNLTNNKFRTWNEYRSTNEEAYNYPHIRYGEILLTYAEALFERDGSISDADLDLSINILRDRAKIAPLTNALVTTNNLDMLNEIRRERTVELYIEDNNHWNDIRRWDTAKNILSDDIVGYVIEGSEYDTNIDLFDPAIAIHGFKNDYQSGVGPVKALIIDPASDRPYNQDNYLWPLPLDELVLNTNLKQNPGW